MSAIVKPTEAETLANATFEALLWALSRPGMPRRLPQAGESQIISALLDRECRAYSVEPRLLPEIMRTGAEIAEIEDADHVFLSEMPSVDDLSRVPIGSDLYPDDGATVVLRARLGQGQPVAFSGPGVDGVLTLQIDGLPAGFWPARSALLRYPMGFDLFILDGAQVIGVPRSTKVEVQ